MNRQPTSAPPIAFKWISYLLMIGFAYYWLFTLSTIFFKRKTITVMPRQSALYRTFWRQNWQLFAVARVYNRQLNFIVRDKNNPAVTDTIDLVRYCITQKIKQAPFNNYEDAIERLLFKGINHLETQLNQKKQAIKQTMPGKPDNYYLQYASRWIADSTSFTLHFDNLHAMGKFVLQNEKRATGNKEYSMQIVHVYIPPQQPHAGNTTNGNEQLIFESPFKPL